jgi:hypothetical protein
MKILKKIQTHSKYSDEYLGINTNISRNINTNIVMYINTNIVMYINTNIKLVTFTFLCHKFDFKLIS